MSDQRPFRFGVQLSQPLPGLSWADSARQVEAWGYSTLFVPDHFGDQLAPIVALAVAAEATTELNVGCLVFDNDYRHPVVLAKEMATLDFLSGGRTEFGLGSGWMLTDYEQSGIAHDKPGIRVDRFAEAISIIKGLWGDGAVDHVGEHYTITGLDGLPKPHRPGGPKVLIGGGGKRMLGLAAEHADIVGINPTIASGAIGPELISEAVADAFDQKLNTLKSAAGDRMSEIELNVLCFFVSVTDDASATFELISSMFGGEAAGVTAEAIAQTPYVLAGTVEGICETLNERRNRWGVSYPVVQGDAAEALAPVVAQLTGN